LGTTTYFATGSDGSDLYPANHVKFFQNTYQYTRHLSKGTQNVNPGFMPLQEHEDYSSASFYRVKVTGGEGELYIGGEGGSNPAVGGDGKINY
jgi:hypothetical protein